MHTRLKTSTRTAWLKEMDEKLSESMNDEHFANTKDSQDGGEPGGTGGQGHLEGQSDQGQLGQAVPDVMIESVGPDELGKSLLLEEVDNVQPKLLVQPFKSPPPKVVISEAFNLKKLLENINKCGRYRYIVVNATADKANVMVKTQNALFDVLKLCDATSLIIQNFQSGAGNILEKLRVACLYLQDGFPDFAMTDIESIRKDVAMMRERCGKTLEKVPGDDLSSMDDTITRDLKQMKSVLPEDIVSNEMQSLGRFPEEDSIDSFTPPGEMQESIEGIEEVSMKNDQYAQLVDEEKDKELDVMVAAVEEHLSLACSLDPDRDSGHGSVSSKMHGSLIAIDVMQRSGIEDVSKKNDQYAQLVDEDASLTSDTPAQEESWVYVGSDRSPSHENVLTMIAEDESKRQYMYYTVIAMMLRAIKCMWMKVKDSFIIVVYKYLLGYKEPLDNPEEDEPQYSGAENSPRSVAKRPIYDQDVIDNIDSYMRAKLTSEISKIVKELYEDIRKVIKNALDLTEKWYQECKTLVQPVMKLNVEKTQGMSKAEQEKFWQTCDPEFADKAEAYLRRWSELQEYCEGHRKDIRKLRQVIEGYYIDNPYPREAIKNSWKLAAKEDEKRILKVVAEWRSYMRTAEAVGVE